MLLKQEDWHRCWRLKGSLKKEREEHFKAETLISEKQG